MIRKVNPVAKAMLQGRRRTQVVPDNKQYNRNKEKTDAVEQEYRKGDSKEVPRGSVICRKFRQSGVRYDLHSR